MSKISFAITVCDEHEELLRLLTLLTKHLHSTDEIVVLCDKDKTTDVVSLVLQQFDIIPSEYSLNNDFATFKNYLNSLCNRDWIFHLDADEFPDIFLLATIHGMLDDNDSVDAFWVPRVNTVEGLTQEDIDRWGWRVNEDGWVNFPDYQMRIYKNKKEIKWTKPVHEQLVGYVTYARLPDLEGFSLHHPKTIDRQRKQNALYEKINSDSR